MALNDVLRFVGDAVTGTGLTVYSVIWRANASGSTQIYNTVTGSFVACNEANWASYAITLSEGCAASYATALPLPLQLPARNYHVATYQRVGATPDPNADTFLGAAEHNTGNLNLTVLPSVQSACVEEGDDIVFLISCTTEDGPIEPGSVVVGVEGTGSAVQAAVAGHPSIRKITYTAAAGSAGTNDCVIATVTFNFPDLVNNYGSVVHKVGVPIFICEAAAGGACPSEAVIAAEVLSVLDAAHGAGTWVAPTAAAVATQVDTTLAASHGAGSWEGASEAAIANQVDIVLSATHGAGLWESPDAPTVAAEVDVVLTAAHGPGGWTTGIGGGTGIEITS